MATQRQRLRRRIAGTVLSLAMICGGAVSGLAAQEQDSSSSFVKDVIKQVVIDPTTYAPSAIAYDATIRDWKTSQPFFRSGFVEHNSRYTISGLPNDVPLHNRDGNRRIFVDAVATLGMSAAHNALERTIERGLLTRYPNHGRLIGVMGWIERVSFGVGTAYVLSIEHYRQAQANAAQGKALGLR